MTRHPSIAIPSSHAHIEPRCAALYRGVLHALSEGGVPFLVGGGYALNALTGLRRDTRDLDLFVRRDDIGQVARFLRAAGHTVELTHPHWLAKVHAHGRYVDLIFSSGNGVADVDDEWFAHARDATMLGEAVRIPPPEETIWSKAFIMERERYDGADIAHLLRACGPTMDWQRLLRRFGAHWRVLLAHLVLFGFVYPADRTRVPAWLMDDLLGRARREANEPPPATNVCGGTLLSREQYLEDVERFGLADGRVEHGAMSPQEVSRWTDAIPPERRALSPSAGPLPSSGWAPSGGGCGTPQPGAPLTPPSDACAAGARTTPPPPRPAAPRRPPARRAKRRRAGPWRPWRGSRRGRARSS
jgi:hypothetical protein